MDNNLREQTANNAMPNSIGERHTWFNKGEKSLADQEAALVQMHTVAAENAAKAATTKGKSPFDAFVNSIQDTRAAPNFDKMKAMYDKQQHFAMIWDALTLFIGAIVTAHLGFEVAVFREQFAPPGKVANLKTLMNFYPHIFLGLFLIFEENTGMRKQIERMVFPAGFRTSLHIHTPLFDKQIISNEFIHLRLKHLLGVAVVLGGGAIGWILGKRWWKERLDYIQELEEKPDWTLQKYIKVGEDGYDAFERFVAVEQEHEVKPGNEQVQHEANASNP